MEGEFKVRAVEFEEKSAVEIEEKLLKEHEEKLNAKSEPQEQVNIAEVPEADIDENKIISYLGKRYNKEISSLDDIWEQRQVNEELPEDVSAFLKYKKETGRGINDFMNLSKDYNSMDQDTLLFDFYKEQNKELDSDDVRWEIQNKFSFDEDFDDEKDVKRKQVAKKKELAKAKEYFNNLKEQYKVPLESGDSFVPQEEKDAYRAYKEYRETTTANEQDQERRSKYFADKTNELFSDKFEGFKFSIDEDKKLVYKPAESQELLKEQSTLKNFINKFLNDDGYLQDAEMFHRSIAVASNPEKFAKFFYEKGKSEAVEGVARESKNIDMTRNATSITPQQGFQVRSVDADRGNRLVIRKNKT
jgi:hypothetical protein